MKELTVYLATDQNLAPNPCNGNDSDLEIVTDKEFSSHVKTLNKFVPKEITPELSSASSKTLINKENLFQLINNASDDLKVVVLVTNDLGKSKLNHDPKLDDYMICDIQPNEMGKLAEQFTKKIKDENNTAGVNEGADDHEKKLSEKFELTETEVEILKLICEEKTSEEIADKICLGRRTIEHYRSRILSKTNSRSPIGLVKFAIKNKLFVDL